MRKKNGLVQQSHIRGVNIELSYRSKEISQMDERRSLEAIEMLLDYVDSGGLIIASTRDSILLENADQVIRGQ